jgi:predicted acylesterase/phospholipase RssA
VTDPPRTELRLALVMNGGVSLAVWMGGVAHEIALLARASRQQLPPPPDHPDRPVYDQWAKLCAEHGVVVTVDVIAGTSAGGINGALLATALARNSSLGHLRELWRTSASLSPGKLLRPDALDPISSVLDGKYFAGKVRAAFDQILEESPEDNDKDHSPEITLFTTATAVGSQTRVFRDSTGTEILADDHRQLYRFRHHTVHSYDSDIIDRGRPWQSAFRNHEENDFRGAGSSARLALAARASAGFPVAFEPVWPVTAEANLESVQVRGGSKRYLVDGGILNNAPFGPVLEEIARRPTDKPWKRMIVYVVPSGNNIEPHPAKPEHPDWIDTLLAAIRMPSEADLRSGLEELTALQRTADDSVHTTDRLLRTLLSGADEAERLTTAAGQLLPEYRLSQVRGSILDALTLWSAEGEVPRVDDDRLGAAQPNEEMRWIPPADGIEWHAQDWRWGTAAAERCVRMLLRSAASGEAEAREGVIRTISEALRRVEAVRDEVEAQVRALAPAQPERTPYELVLDIIDSAVDAARVSRVCGRLVEDAAAAYGRILSQPPSDVSAIVRCCLTAEVLMHALISRPFQRPTGFDFLRLGPDIESPVVGPILDTDALTPIALGPCKLWGTQLGHFAAFGREEWRMHDWVWGRLDAAAHLAGAVRQAGRPDARTGDAVRELHSGILQAEGTHERSDIAAEGARLNKETKALATMTASGVIDLFRQDDEGRDTSAALVNAVLQTLRHRGRHATAGRFGDWISTLFAEKVAPELDDEVTETVVRFFGNHLRRRLWRLVRDPKPASRAAAATPIAPNGGDRSRPTREPTAS